MQKRAIELLQVEWRRSEGLRNLWMVPLGEKFGVRLGYLGDLGELRCRWVVFYRWEWLMVGECLGSFRMVSPSRLHSSTPTLLLPPVGPPGATRCRDRLKRLVALMTCFPEAPQIFMVHSQSLSNL
jgi:hypothetical protein